MPFLHFHENNKGAQMTRITMKANQSKHLVSVVSHDRPGRYIIMVFNEMMAGIDMPLSLFLLFFVEINIPVMLNFIFFHVFNLLDVQWFYIKCTVLRYKSFNKMLSTVWKKSTSRLYANKHHRGVKLGTFDNDRKHNKQNKRDFH